MEGRRCRLTALLAVLAIVVCAAPLCAQSGSLTGPFIPGTGNWNTLYNGGWELGNTSGWTHYTGAGNYVATQEKAAVGNWSLKSQMDYSATWELGLWRDISGLTVGQTYVLSAFFYTGQAGGTARIDRDHGISQVAPAYKVDEWQFVWGSWTATSTDTKVRIFRNKPTNTTDIGMYYDEIAVTPLGAFAPPTVVPEPTSLLALAVGLTGLMARRRK